MDDFNPDNAVDVKASYDTPLAPEEEKQFQVWKTKFAPNDSGDDYDLRGAYKAELNPDPETGHWPDTYKKPNHPTFSDQSVYASPEHPGGHWDGKHFLPHQETPELQDLSSPIAATTAMSSQPLAEGIGVEGKQIPLAIGEGFNPDNAEDPAQLQREQRLRSSQILDAVDAGKLDLPKGYLASLKHQAMDGTQPLDWIKDLLNPAPVKAGSDVDYQHRISHLIAMGDHHGAELLRQELQSRPIEEYTPEQEEDILKGKSVDRAEPTTIGGLLGHGAMQLARGIKNMALKGGEREAIKASPSLSPEEKDKMLNTPGAIYDPYANIISGAVKALSSIPPILGDATVATANAGSLVLGGAMGYDWSPEQQALREKLSLAATDAHHSFSKWSDTFGEVIGGNPDTPEGEVSSFLTTGAIPIGAETKAASLIAHGSESMVENLPKVVGAGLMGASKVGRVALPVGALAATAAHHPLAATAEAVAMLAGYKGGFIKRARDAVMDATFGKTEALAGRLMATKEGVTIMGGIRKDIIDEVDRLGIAETNLRKSASPKDLEFVDQIDTKGKFIHDEGDLTPLGNKIREKQILKKEKQDRYDSLKLAEDANKVLSDGAKYTLGIAGHIGVAGATVAGLGGLQAEPEETVAAMKEGWKAGVAMGMIPATFLAARGMKDLRLDKAGAALSAMGDEAIANHPDIALHNETVSKLPREVQNAIRIRNGIGAPIDNNVIVLPPEEILKRSKKSSSAVFKEDSEGVIAKGDAKAKAVAPNGFYSDPTKGGDGHTYLNSEKLQTNVWGHEMGHALEKGLGTSAIRALPGIERGMRDPATAPYYKQFAQQYLEAMRRSMADYPGLNDEQIKSEALAELGRITLNNTPPEFFFGGESGGDVFKRWLFKVMPEKYKNATMVDPVLGSPYSRQAIQDLKANLYQLGEAAKDGRDLRRGTSPESPVNDPNSPVGSGQPVVNQNAVAVTPELPAHVQVNISNAEKALHAMGMQNPKERVAAAVAAMQARGEPITTEGVLWQAQHPGEAPRNPVKHGEFKQEGYTAFEPKPPEVQGIPAAESPPIQGIPVNIKEAAQAHAAAHPDTDLVTHRVDKYGDTSISGSRLDPSDPFHQELIQKAGLSPDEVAVVNLLMENKGKPVALTNYKSAPVEGVEVSKPTRQSEQQVSPAQDREAGIAASQAANKNFVPSSISFTEKGGIVVRGFSPDKLATNVDKLIEAGVKGYDSHEAAMTDMNKLIENHANGFTDTGKPVKGTDHTRVTPNEGYRPHILTDEQANFLNLAIGNRYPELGKTDRQLNAMDLADANKPGGNPLWKSIPPELAGRLESAAEAIKPKLVGDLDNVSTEGGIRKSSTLKGAPRQDFAQAGFMPAGETGHIRTDDGKILTDKGMQFMPAHHGTPHEFDKFDTSKIGTGEGAQVYGHGLYFAENKGVAESYKEGLSKSQGMNLAIKQDGKIIRKGDGLDSADIEAIKWLTRGKGEAGEFPHNTYYYAKKAFEATQHGKSEWYDRVSSRMDEIKDAEFPYVKTKGNTYTVEIDAEPHELLDWDKPLSEQNPQVKTLLSKFDPNQRVATGIAYDRMARELGSPKAASEALSRAGIKGIRYLDQGSRSDGKGTSNYVIFDDKHISITHKNGEPIKSSNSHMPPTENERDLSDYKGAPSRGGVPVEGFNPNFKQSPPVSDDVIRNALTPAQAEKVGAHRSLPKGEPISVRIDVSAWEDHHQHVSSVHADKLGKIVGYDSVVRLDGPITFRTNEKIAEKIRDGEAKRVFASVNGKFNPDRTLPKDINDREVWTPVGFNPRDHSHYYTKETQRPVIGGEEATMIGDNAYIKNPKLGKAEDFQYMPSTPPETEEFKRWSGGAKVVLDSGPKTYNLGRLGSITREKKFQTGEPVVVGAYHGSPSEKFTVFDEQKLGKYTGAPSSKEGFFFAGKPETAKDYHRPESPQSYISTAAHYKELKEIANKNGKTEEASKYAQIEDELTKKAKELTDNPKLGTMHEVYVKFENPMVHDFKGETYREESYYDLLKKAKKDGHDGAIFTNTFDGGENPDNIFVAFKNTNIKSTENRGTFDPHNPDIQFMPSSHPEAIDSAAAQMPDGKIYKGMMHMGAFGEAVSHYSEEQLSKWIKEFGDDYVKSGFTNKDGTKFWDREEALVHAKKIGQATQEDLQEARDSWNLRDDKARKVTGLESLDFDGVRKFMPSDDPRAIKEAAVEVDGKIYSGKTHADSVRDFQKQTGKEYDYFKNQEGFVSNDGEFLDRTNAEARAQELNQIRRSTSGGKLETTDFNRNRVFMPSSHPDAIDVPAIQRKSDGKIFKAPDKSYTHWMMNEVHPELSDMHTLDGHNKYEWGWTDKKGNFLDKDQAHARAVETDQIPENAPTEYKGSLSSGDMRAFGEHMPSTEPTVNIGLNTNDGKGITPEEALSALKKAGVEVPHYSVHQSDTEPTLVATLSRPLTNEEAHQVAVDTGQEAIAQHDGTEGELHGPKAENWRPFNPDYFLNHEGESGTQFMPHTEALPVTKNEAGNVNKIPYALDSTALGKKAGKGLTGADKHEAITDAYAKKLVDYMKVVKDDPTIMAGEEWYKLAREKIVKLFGKDSQLFAELLAATSPNTDPEQNFKYALHAYDMFKRGKFDRHVQGYMDALGKMESGEIKKGQMRDHLDANDLIPRQENGKLFGFHSERALSALARKFVEQNPKALKILQFSRNLSGEDFQATIDVWAARMLHRLGNEEAKGRWRIQPQSEAGVQPKDFHIGQAAFRKAAEKLGIQPDALQAIMWFAEKDVWDKNNWTKGAGREKMDFSRSLDKLPSHPETGLYDMGIPDAPELSGITK